MGRADCQNTTCGEGLPGARHCAGGSQRSGPCCSCGQAQRASDADDRQPVGNGARHFAGGVERDDLGPVSAGASAHLAKSTVNSAVKSLPLKPSDGMKTAWRKVVHA